MAQLQHRGRGAVVLPAAEPRAQPHPMLMPHGGGRLVAHPPAGRGQPPDQVDVLPDPHGLGETGPRRGPPHHQGRAGHVRDARPRPDDARPGAHVQGGTGPLVPRQPRAPGLIRDDARRDRAHRRVREVRQQRVQPARTRNAVRVEERDQRCVRRGQAGVPGRRGTAVYRAAQDAGSRAGHGPRGRGRIGRTVVDHDHPRHLRLCWPGRPPARQARQRVSSACRSRTGITTVTSAGPHGAPPGTGCAMPVSSRRRASARAFGLSGTGVPDHQPAT